MLFSSSNKPPDLPNWELKYISRKKSAEAKRCTFMHASATMIPSRCRMTPKESPSHGTGGCSSTLFSPLSPFLIFLLFCVCFEDINLSCENLRSTFRVSTIIEIAFTALLGDFSKEISRHSTDSKEFVIKLFISLIPSSEQSFLSSRFKRAIISAGKTVDANP